MDTDQAILTQIAEELPYLEYLPIYNTHYNKHPKPRDRTVIPILRFGSGARSSEIYINDGYLHIYLYLSHTKIDLFTCKDLVKEIDEYIKKHVPIKSLKYGY